MRHLEKRWKDTQTRQVRLRQSNFKNEFEDVWNILKYRWQCCKAVGLLCSTCLHLLSFWSLAHNWQRLVTTCKINSQDWGRKRCSPYRLPTKSLQLGSRSAVGEKGTSDPCETAPPLKWNPAMVLPILWKERICLCNRNTATDWTRRSWNDLMHLITSGSQQAWFVCRQHPTASDSIRQESRRSTAITSNRPPPPDLHPSDVEAVCIDCHNPKSAAASPSRCLSSKNPGVLQRQHFCTSALWVPKWHPFGEIVGPMGPYRRVANHLDTDGFCPVLALRLQQDILLILSTNCWPSLIPWSWNAFSTTYQNISKLYAIIIWQSYDEDWRSDEVISKSCPSAFDGNLASCCARSSCNWLVTSCSSSQEVSRSWRQRHKKKHVGNRLETMLENLLIWFFIYR